MTVVDGQYYRAVVWCNWLPGADRVLEFHAAAAKNARGTWLSRKTLDALSQIIAVTDCRTVMAQAGTSLAHRIWASLGATIVGGIAYIDVETWKNGKPS